MPGVDGDAASLDAWFIVFDVRGAQRPPSVRTLDGTPIGVKCMFN